MHALTRNRNRNRFNGHFSQERPGWTHSSLFWIATYYGQEPPLVLGSSCVGPRQSMLSRNVSVYRQVACLSLQSFGKSASSFPGRAVQRVQIGRASCRERV